MSDADPNPRRLVLPLALCASLVVAPLFLHGSGSRAGHVTVAADSGARGSQVVRAAGGRVPRVLSDGASRSDSRPLTAAELAALADAAAAPDMVSAQAASAAVPTAPPTAGSTLDATPTTVASSGPTERRAVAQATTTTTEPPTTTTTRPPATTTTTRPPTTTTTQPTTTTTGASSNSETGSASWYQAPSGTCAHPSLPFGTVVTVTNLANGATTKCTVEDRGPYEGGRIIDLSEGTFSQIASPSEGVIQVRIQW